nr:retrovirus-related Pol polyprotein from transposon TNT 1-94 [Tanacetum cinerariifolium]
MKAEESLNAKFDESPPPMILSPLVDDDVGKDEAIIKNTKVVNNNNKEDESIEVDEIVNVKESKNHLLDQVIGNLIQRTLRYIRGTSYLGLWYRKVTKVETIVYAESDHAGDYIDRKSTSGVCAFMGCCLTSWFAKKQTILAISTTEAEYVYARKAELEPNNLLTSRQLLKIASQGEPYIVRTQM